MFIEYLSMLKDETLLVIYPLPLRSLQSFWRNKQVNHQLTITTEASWEVCLLGFLWRNILPESGISPAFPGIRHFEYTGSRLLPWRFWFSRSGECWAMESVSVSAPGDTDLGSLRYRLDIKFQLCKTNTF